MSPFAQHQRVHARLPVGCTGCNGEVTRRAKLSELAPQTNNGVDSALTGFVATLVVAAFSSVIILLLL